MFVTAVTKSRRSLVLITLQFQVTLEQGPRTIDNAGYWFRHFGARPRWSGPTLGGLSRPLTPCTDDDRLKWPLRIPGKSASYRTSF